MAAPEHIWPPFPWPPRPQAFHYVYAAKFLCGEWKERELEGPVEPGRYATAINVHNPHTDSVAIRKKAILLFDGSKPQDANERPLPPTRREEPVMRELRPDWGLEIDCRDIRETLLREPSGEPGPPAPTFIKGWIVIETLSDSPLDVVAVYTVVPAGEQPPVSIATDRVAGNRLPL
jgi:hypothetical protein